jgi:hypothetical protein
MARILGLLVLVVVFAGCGSSPSPEEKFADSVCSAVGDWQDQVTQSASDVKAKVQSPSTGMITAIQQDVQSAVDATNTLISSLSSVEAPDSDEGKAAKQQLDTLATQFKTTVDKSKQTVNGIPKNASLATTASSIATLGPSLDTLATTAQTTITAVQASGDALKDGFQKADSCNRYT